MSILLLSILVHKHSCAAFPANLYLVHAQVMALVSVTYLFTMRVIRQYTVNSCVRIASPVISRPNEKRYTLALKIMLRNKNIYEKALCGVNRPLFNQFASPFAH